MASQYRNYTPASIKRALMRGSRVQLGLCLYGSTSVYEYDIQDVEFQGDWAFVTVENAGTLAYLSTDVIRVKVTGGEYK